MSVTVYQKTYADFAVDKAEILRYAGVKGDAEQWESLLDGCLHEVQGKADGKVCYCVLPLSIQGDVVDFSYFSVRSDDLARVLANAEKAVLFMATVGVEMDRLVQKYVRLSPSKALFMQAIGTACVEAVCDAFCADFARIEGVGVTRRFSPGYGDLPLETQREVFRVLAPERKVGVTLTDSLLMKPSKTVTAFFGVGKGCDDCMTGCALCQKTDCELRRL